MSYAERREHLSRLEEERGSRLLCYWLSDRPSFPPIPGCNPTLATEPHLIFVDHLREIGKVEKLDVVLYTRGGDTNSVWPLINLLREFSEHLTVVVPFRAHSGGTLICLGADELILTEIAELSPIDPTTGNQFNPSDPKNPDKRFGISVEDVSAFFDLAEKRAKAESADHRVGVLGELTKNVHPLALGNVQRVHLQIRQLAENLLKLHLDPEDATIKRIVEALTKEFYSHVHAISRQEASTLMGEWVRFPTEEESIIIWEIFDAYADFFQLNEKYILAEEMGDEPVKEINVLGGAIESTVKSHLYTTPIKVGQRPNLPPNVQVQVPPGQPIPLGPWPSRLYDFGIFGGCWRENEEGV